MKQIKKHGKQQKMIMCQQTKNQNKSKNSEVKSRGKTSGAMQQRLEN